MLVFDYKNFCKISVLKKSCDILILSFEGKILQEDNFQELFILFSITITFLQEDFLSID